MADTITNTVVERTKKRLVVLSNISSDGTGSTDAILVDKSAYTGLNDSEPSKFVVENVEFACDGMQVVLEFEHTADDIIASLAGHGTFDFSKKGRFQGMVDPASAGGTGDIVATTVGHSLGDKATILTTLRLKD